MLFPRTLECVLVPTSFDIGFENFYLNNNAYLKDKGIVVIRQLSKFLKSKSLRMK